MKQLYRDVLINNYCVRCEKVGKHSYLIQTYMPEVMTKVVGRMTFFMFDGDDDDSYGQIISPQRSINCYHLSPDGIRFSQ